MIDCSLQLMRRKKISYAIALSLCSNSVSLVASFFSIGLAVYLSFLPSAITLPHIYIALNFFLAQYFFTTNLSLQLQQVSFYRFIQFSQNNRGIKTQRTIKTKKPLLFCMNGLISMIGCLVCLVHNPVGIKDVNKLINRPLLILY